MITNKQLLTFALILTLAPQTTQPSALTGTIKDFATEHPLIVGGAAITLVGVGTFMGGRASRNLELSTKKETITALRGQLTQHQNQSNALEKQLQNAQEESAQALKAANSFQDNLGKLFQATNPDQAVPENLTLDMLCNAIRSKRSTLQIALDQLLKTHAQCDQQKKQLEEKLEQLKKEHLEALRHKDLVNETLGKECNAHKDTANKLAAEWNDEKEKYDANIAVLKDKMAKLVREICTSNYDLAQQQCIVAALQNTNGRLLTVADKACEEILKNTDPERAGSFQCRDDKDLQDHLDETKTRIGSNSSKGLSFFTREQVAKNRELTDRMRGKSHAQEQEEEQAAQMAEEKKQAAIQKMIDERMQQEWNELTNPAHFDIAATSSDAVTDNAAAEQDDNDNPSTNY